VTRNPLEKDQKDPLYYMYGRTEKTELVYPFYARGLKPGWTYFWTVIPLDKDNKPIARPARPARFIMADFQTLGVRGFYPNGEIALPADKMVFDWTPVGGVTKYKIEVSSSKNMEKPLISKETDTNYYVLENSSMYFFKGKEYFWKVTPLEKEEGTPELKGVVNQFKIAESK